MNEYISLKEYAGKNKISIFNVIRLVKANKVEYITKIENDKEVIYIKNQKPKNEDKKSKKTTIEDLENKIKELEERVKRLEAIVK